jgi:hypothetical protein
MNSDSSGFASKGKDREASLRRSDYFSDGYFSLHQLCSFAHQINLLHSLGPRSVLEVGMGNGFTSLYLRRSGIDVTTVDINPSLGPDVCCDLQSLPSSISGCFDVVSCCEVLEHLPWSDFEESVSTLRKFSNTLFLSLPYGRRIVGAGGFLRLPDNKYIRMPANKTLGLWFPLPFIKKSMPREHFWELDCSRETTTKAVLGILRKYYSAVDNGIFQLNPYHRYFICRSLESANRPGLLCDNGPTVHP